MVKILVIYGFFKTIRCKSSAFMRTQERSIVPLELVSCSITSGFGQKFASHDKMVCSGGNLKVVKNLILVRNRGLWPIQSIDQKVLF